MIVTEEKGEDQTNGKESVCNVIGRLNLEMAIDVECEEEKWRRIDLFGKELDEVLFNFLGKLRALHIELSNYYLEIKQIIDC